ncbi:GntR family transcriptional regulator [Staphylococcus agnetis]|uniref:GntR family transcriptional regulator n=2 Tax=Staphylococcus agnetis TaxID=985762 RepID=UPI000D1AC07A|nr:GntR family transcriptional regulator [Staphylococcus agnetis]MCO4325561.1 GntR family transcriptional regulator [Staphylococcus agnetis]MCO4337484.1 GntR family transcriptional regulator [Staphylococcus agnetis]MCO4339947.1 GntR family transcriptional regulator [Staphylococcus agnetis]MCO4342287.1 GntR family transcriptional regulator [Staphylococcus agnetis]MCO4344584.1 GntR family transcriptional regulator [Staphylococcus agnetis]
MLKYEAIASKMKALLDGGDYQQGDRLPNLEQLKAKYEVSKSTIIKALEILEKEGYIYQSRGSGIFVRTPKREGYINLFTSNGFTDDLHTHQVTSEVIEVKELAHPDAIVMQYLHLNAHDKVYFVKRVRYIDNKILCIENAYFNQNLVVYMSEEIAKGSIFRYLENNLKINIGYSDIYFNIGTLKQDESELLKQPFGTPTLRYEQVVYTKTGIPFDYSQIIFHHENAKFYIPSIR